MYDVRELQGGSLDDEDTRLVSPLVGSLEKERGVLVDDPRWQGKRVYVSLYFHCCPVSLEIWPQPFWKRNLSAFFMQVRGRCVATMVSRHTP